jgi:hypothetical protein
MVIAAERFEHARIGTAGEIRHRVDGAAGKGALHIRGGEVCGEGRALQRAHRPAVENDSRQGSVEDCVADVIHSSNVVRLRFSHNHNCYPGLVPGSIFLGIKVDPGINPG